MDARNLDSIAGTLREIPFPKKFAVEICSECNLSCAMCYQPGMKRAKGVMPFELWKKCADEIADVSPGTECWFSFCGEPLLEPERLTRFIAYGKSIGLRSLNVNTNGMLLTREVSEMLLDSGVDLVVIGIDGFRKETYERIRLGGERDVVYRNAEDFLRARDARGGGPEIQVQFIEMDENEDELAEFTSYWLQRGAVAKIRHQLSWGGTFETRLQVSDDDRIPCPWALTMMHVFWNGYVPRCPGDYEGQEGSGNVYDESLRALWGNLAVYRKLHLERRFDELPERCLTCQDWMTGAASRIRPASVGTAS